MHRSLIAATLLILGIGSAPAQDWPTRPMTLVVPFAAITAFASVLSHIVQNLSLSQIKTRVIPFRG